MLIVALFMKPTMKKSGMLNSKIDQLLNVLGIIVLLGIFVISNLKNGKLSEYFPPSYYKI